MKKIKQTVENTTDSRVYKMAQRHRTLGCPLCPPHGGCNRFKSSNEYRSWKYWRKKQWKQEYGVTVA